ncbi:hypothetical protein KL933_004807 [Ogataea haglerorum]|uniref:Uncharacterized protein n=1 Tax=Ogataea haglerorum TaxID=1937702 RepID=A0AAN6D1J7_9ASCO|nr:hypothetical protein KL933_004807 [Ogataea haglerorum]KAG7762119.1 hypothetical protein KL946_004766 [Ogataea haglerorum]KAG7784845.1 hypothetical protein KL945_004064 [Ogataea haglerorum]KAG7785299.1 hypothetical protein KL910_004679 [Ogataea haglerorum]
MRLPFGQHSPHDNVIFFPISYLRYASDNGYKIPNTFLFRDMLSRELAHQIFRSSLTQAFLIGLLSFTQPGIYTAISGLGAGGQATTHTYYVSTVIINSLMTGLAPIFSIFANLFGLKLTLFIGCIGYAIYSSSLYYNSKTGNQVFILVASVILGFSGAAFWTSEGAVVMSYPEKSRRGLFIGIWAFLNKFGGIISGSIVFSLNYSGTKKGQVSLNTYVALLSIQCVGPFLAVALSPPEKVLRKDGTKPETNLAKGNLQQIFRRYVKLVSKKEVLYLLPIFLVNTWYKTWQSNFMTHNFSVRTRALNVLLTSVIGCAVDLLGGAFLDCQRIPLHLRVRISWLIIVFFNTAFFIWGFVVQKYVLTHDLGPLDWATGGYYYNTYVPMQIFKIPGEFVFNWVFWVVGVNDFTSEELSYLSGLIRGFESLGGTLSYVVGVANGNDMTNLSVAAGAFWVVIPVVTYISWRIREKDSSTVVYDEEVSETVNSAKEKQEVIEIVKEESR